MSAVRQNAMKSEGPNLLRFIENCSTKINKLYQMKADYLLPGNRLSRFGYVKINNLCCRTDFRAPLLEPCLQLG